MAGMDMAAITLRPNCKSIPIVLLFLQKYVKNKRNASEYAKTVRSVKITLATVWGDF